MKLILIIITASLISISAYRPSYAQTFAEIEFSLGQIIDPTLKYLDCDKLNSLEQLACKTIAGNFKQAISDAVISILTEGIVYNKNDIVPAVRFGNCAHSFKIDGSNLNVLASRDSTFKFEIESLSKPLIFSAKIPSKVGAKINLHEAFGLTVPVPGWQCDWWYGCIPTVDYVCAADDLITDHFSADAGMASNANIVMAFSLEPRLLPRTSPYDDYKVEIAPKVLIDGSLDNIALNFSISGRNELLDNLMSAVSVPSELNIATADQFKALSGDYSTTLTDIAMLSLDTSVYPIVSSTLVALNIAPEFFDNLLTELLRRRIQNVYSVGYSGLETIINSKIANALKLDANGKLVFTIKKEGGASTSYDATLVGGQTYDIPLYQAPGSPYLASNSSYCTSSDENGSCYSYATAPVIGYLSSANFANGVPLYQAPGSPFLTSNSSYCTSSDENGSCYSYATAPVIGYLSSANFANGVPLYQAPGSPFLTSNSSYCASSDENGSCYSYATAPVLGYLAPATGINGGTNTCPFGGTLSGTTCIPSIDTLNVTKLGAGKGTISSPTPPSVVNCDSTCSYSFVQNTSVTLTATPKPGNIFTGWSGACSGKGTCSVTMNANQSVSATFVPDITPILNLLLND